jgi:hypothetical protein
MGQDEHSEEVVDDSEWPSELFALQWMFLTAAGAFALDPEPEELQPTPGRGRPRKPLFDPHANLHADTDVLVITAVELLLRFCVRFARMRAHTHAHTHTRTHIHTHTHTHTHTDKHTNIQNTQTRARALQ